MFIPKVELEGFNITLKDLKTLIKECDKLNIPDSTILEMDTLHYPDITKIKHIVADTESIRFYDWT